MLRWIRRSAQTRQQSSPRYYRPRVEGLEDRYLLAAPVINALPFAINLPAGKSVIVPITGSDPAGGGVTYSVTTSDSNITVQSHANPTFLQLNVANFGTMEFELLGDVAPQTVALISGLVKSEFYNGLTFHRILNGFVIQGGDPAGNGTGGPGFTFTDEFNANTIYSGSGQLALANTRPDTNGSQFFISDGPQRGLDFNNVIFGQLISGLDVLKAIAATPVDANEKPLTPVVITSAQIIQDTHDAVFTLVNAGTTGSTATLTVTATASTGGSTTQNFTINNIAETTNDPPFLNPLTAVNSPATLVSPTSIVTAANNSISFTLTRTDLENDASTFEATPSDTTNADVTVTPNASNTSATITILPLNGFTGQIQVTLGVEEMGATARGNTINPPFFDTEVINVAWGDMALTAGSPVAITANEGAAANNIIVGQFTDVDSTSVAADFQVRINWGDGTATDTTTGALTGSSGVFQVTGSHTYKEAGSFPVKAVVTDAHTSANPMGGDNGGAVATLLNSAAVSAAALTAQGVAVTATQASPLTNVTVATFTDADPNGKVGDFTATVNWGDGTTTAGVVAAGASGGFTVTGSHTYGAGGSFTVTTTITDVVTAGDVSPATATATSTATVQAAPAGPTSPNQAYVDHLYTTLLNRPVDTAGETNSVNFLNHGGTRAQLVAIIGGSTEGRTVQVNSLYLQHLGRAADPTALSLNVPYLQKGGSLLALTVQILSSQEFFNTRGNGTANGFLGAAFQGVLGRPIDSAAQSVNSAFLTQGGSRAAVAAVIVFSAENEFNLLKHFSTTLLGQAADPSLLTRLENLPPAQREQLLDQAVANFLAVL